MFYRCWSFQITGSIWIILLITSLWLFQIGAVLFKNNQSCWHMIYSELLAHLELHFQSREDSIPADVLFIKLTELIKEEKVGILVDLSYCQKWSSNRPLLRCIIFSLDLCLKLKYIWILSQTSEKNQHQSSFSR